MDTATFEKWIAAVVKRHGYRRKNGRYWIKFSDECVLFINLQVDTPHNYLNLGVLIRSLVPGLTFENFKWNYHILKRADGDLGELMNLDFKLDVISREARFKDKLESVLIPELDSMGTIDGIKEGISREVGFIPLGVGVKRILGLDLGPKRRIYEAIAFNKDGSIGPTIYELWERDDEADVVRKVGTVPTIEEAEEWQRTKSRMQ